MCSVPQLDIPNVEVRFFTDDCPCHQEPIDMVAYWIDSANTIVTPVAKAQNNPGLWLAIRARYTAWKQAPMPMLLLTADTVPNY